MAAKKHLSAQSLAKNFGKEAAYKPQSMVEKMVQLTEILRQEVLLPSSQKIKQGHLQATHKDTGDLRGGDAKTITVETDNIAENRLIALQRAAFPDAFIIGEEMFGQASNEEKKKLLQQALDHKGLVILNDSLDGTKPFTQGKDGFGTMVSMVKDGKVVGAVVHLSTQHERPDGLGYTLTWEEGGKVRMDGETLTPLTERSFPKDAKMLRGYAGFEFLKGTDALRAAFAIPQPPSMGQKFDSMSDLWTCGTLYRDMLQGRHHFMIVPAPIDVFDYPMGIALIEKAGGVAKFADGTPATLEEIFKRQGFGQPSFDPKNPKETVQHLNDPNHFRSPENMLILAVSEDVFKAVQGVFMSEMLERRRNPMATQLALDGRNPAHANGGSGVAREYIQKTGDGINIDVGALRQKDPEVAKALSVIDLFDSKTFRYISAPLLYSREFAQAIKAPDPAKAMMEQVNDNVLAPNLDRANKAADAHKATGQGALIVPARFDDTKFPFTPSQRMAFLYGVINEKATSLQLLDGWEYSPACIEEYLGALVLQSGRGPRKDISVIDERGTRISVPQAIETIASSIEDMMAGSRPLLVGSQVENFQQLVAVAYELLRDRRQGTSFHAADCMTAEEAARTENLLRDLRPLRAFLEERFGNAASPAHYEDDVAGRIARHLSQKSGMLHQQERQLLEGRSSKIDVPQHTRRKPPQP